jgi:regulation of enolase protein 1 (concanavalin A-like superfamily)
VTLSATDATSGVASTSYAIDGGAAQTYSRPFTVTGIGTHTVTFFSVDYAGNTEATKNVSITVQPNVGGLPNGWSDRDIDGSYPAGSASYASSNWTVVGGGNGIGGTADRFNFASESVSGNTTMTAELTSFNGRNYSAFAGLMLRDSTAAGDLFVDMGYTPQWGAWMQWRTSVNGSAGNTNVLTAPAPSSTHPLWLKLVRNGNTVSGYESANGVSWTTVGSTTVALNTSALAGLAVTSEYNAPVVTATFSDVTAGLPSALSDQDINGSFPAGSASYDGGTWTVAGAGNGIGGTADKFNFASESVTGNTTITAELTSFNGTNYSAFAGLMLRNSAAAGDLFVDMGYTPQWGAWMQWRTSVNGSASNTNVLKMPAPSSAHPLWLKLVQNGTAVTGYESADGVSWTMVGSTTVALSANALAGVAVTSEYNAPLVTATFTNLSVAPSH